jgi:hypothetical protein
MRDAIPTIILLVSTVIFCCGICLGKWLASNELSFKTITHKVLLEQNHAEYNQQTGEFQLKECRE